MKHGKKWKNVRKKIDKTKDYSLVEAVEFLKSNSQVKFENSVYEAKEGDVIYLTSEIPLEWKNTGSEPAMLLWMKIR